MIVKEGGLWVAPFLVDGTMHVFPLDALRADTGVGGWLGDTSLCRDARIAPGAELATKAQAFAHEPFCRGCWTWMLEHSYCHVIYAPGPGASIAEPEPVGVADLADHGWFVS